MTARHSPLSPAVHAANERQLRSAAVSATSQRRAGDGGLWREARRVAEDIKERAAARAGSHAQFIEGNAYGSIACEDLAAILTTQPDALSLSLAVLDGDEDGVLEVPCCGCFFPPLASR